MSVTSKQRANSAKFTSCSWLSPAPPGPVRDSGDHWLCELEQSEESWTAVPVTYAARIAMHDDETPVAVPFAARMWSVVSYTQAWRGEPSQASKVSCVPCTPVVARQSAAPTR